MALRSYLKKPQQDERFHARFSHDSAVIPKSDSQVIPKSLLRSSLHLHSVEKTSSFVVCSSQMGSAVLFLVGLQLRALIALGVAF